MLIQRDERDADSLDVIGDTDDIHFLKEHHFAFHGECQLVGSSLDQGDGM